MSVLLKVIYLRLLGWRPEARWNAENDGRRVIGWNVGYATVGEYCRFPDEGWRVGTFNGNIIHRSPDFFKRIPRNPLKANYVG